MASVIQVSAFDSDVAKITGLARIRTIVVLLS